MPVMIYHFAIIFLDESGLTQMINLRLNMDTEHIRYNKTEKDFPTLLEYNNYLEEVEDISEFSFELPPFISFHMNIMKL